MKARALIAVYVMLGGSAWAQGHLGSCGGSSLEATDSSAAIGLEPAESASSTELGAFFFSNGTALTRIGTLDGPLAGPGIWAQMLAGLTPDSLLPVGQSREHFADILGYVYGGRVEVPNTRPCDLAYVQMVAWDGQRWGASLAGVPAEWLGRTDIVRKSLGGGGACWELSYPPFTQPAIVPIPEPSTLVFLALGTMLLWAPQFFRRARRTTSGTGRTWGAPPDGIAIPAVEQ